LAANRRSGALKSLAGLEIWVSGARHAVFLRSGDCASALDRLISGRSEVAVTAALSARPPVRGNPQEWIHEQA
jgi:hypothetical protein